jgi:small subunit ribosomal protein S6
MSEQPYYETMYILRPDIPEEEVDSHLKKYSEILEKSGTEVLDSQMRGKRRLAYPIAKHKEGIYVQLSHKGNGQQVASLERAMRLSEDVIRYLTVKQDGPLPTPKSTSKDSEPEKSETEKEEIKPTEDKTESSSKDEKKEDSKD